MNIIIAQARGHPVSLAERHHSTLAALAHEIVGDVADETLTVTLTDTARLCLDGAADDLNL